ncbi:MAG: heavy-metal-associated domain-containing protein [Clostridia bacterium]|nr:heavy-metal-associated domain-containing protein [Clostridia bacterium]
MLFAKTEKCVISVEGMHCNHCKAKVENTLKAVKGVKSANADLGCGEAVVTYVDGKVDKDELVKVINEAGFSAKLK